MSAPRRAPVARLLGGLVLTAGLAAALLWMDRRSLEHGNRLLADGDAGAAAALYLRVAERPDAPPAATYNLGTALLARSDPGAAARLGDAAGSADSAVAQRASYNLGYAHLTSVHPSLDRDTAIVLLAASIGASRAAARLDPTDENALWNLALARRMLDSLTVVPRRTDLRSDTGEDDTRVEQTALTRGQGEDGVSGQEPEDARASPTTGRRFGSTMGTSEAWALQDPGPMSESAAAALLRALPDDPEVLVRAILWAGRPDVAWWASEPYPGGDW